ACGQHLEVVQSFKDSPLTVCPNCAGTLRKVFSPVGISFKGSGFYRTDSRAGSGARKGADRASEAADAASTGAASSADSKAGDSKGGDSKGGDSKGGDSKGRDSKGVSTQAARRGEAKTA